MAGDARFPRRARLLRREEFEQVFKQATRSSDACFVVFARRNALSHGRLGLAISKRHVRTAILRNRIRRLARESFRQTQDALAGLDLVILARSSITTKSTVELRDSLRHHWTRLTRLCASS